MKRYHGKETAPRGVYLNLANGELVQLYGGTLVLPGTSGVNYIKIPAALAVIGGPFAGLAFIIFLPLAGLIGVLSFLGYKVGALTLALWYRALQPVMIGWIPGRAYLARRGGGSKRKKPSAKEHERGLEDLTINEIEHEITRRRQKGEQ
jgi:hypothetical protein